MVATLQKVSSEGRVPEYLAFVLKDSFLLLYLFGEWCWELFPLLRKYMERSHIQEAVLFWVTQHTNQKFHPHFHENTIQSHWYSKLQQLYSRYPPMFSDERLSTNQATFSSVKNLSKLFHSSHWFLIFAFTLITYGHISSTLLLWIRAISCWYQFHVLALKLSHLFYCVIQRGYDLGCLYSYCIKNLCRKYLSLCGQRCRPSNFCRKKNEQKWDHELIHVNVWVNFSSNVLVVLQYIENCK